MKPMYIILSPIGSSGKICQDSTFQKQTFFSPLQKRKNLFSRQCFYKKIFPGVWRPRPKKRRHVFWLGFLARFHVGLAWGWFQAVGGNSLGDVFFLDFCKGDVKGWCPTARAKNLEETPSPLRKKNKFQGKKVEFFFVEKLLAILFLVWLHVWRNVWHKIDPLKALRKHKAWLSAS